MARLVTDAGVERRERPGIRLQLQLWAESERARPERSGGTAGRRQRPAEGAAEHSPPDGDADDDRLCGLQTPEDHSETAMHRATSHE